MAKGTHCDSGTVPCEEIQLVREKRDRSFLLEETAKCRVGDRKKAVGKIYSLIRLITRH